MGVGAFDSGHNLFGTILASNNQNYRALLWSPVVVVLDKKWRPIVDIILMGLS